MEKKTDVLVAGSGAREHILAGRLRQSPSLGNLYVAPGNAGTAEIAQNINASDRDSIIQFAAEKRVELVVVGPDNLLAEGLVDGLKEVGIHAIGPKQDAARIESSKVWSYEFIDRYNIPQAKGQVFEKSSEAYSYMKDIDPQNIVLKADGLCLGKGVLLPNDIDEANLWIFNAMEFGAFGEAGSRILISERLSGPEVSLIGLTDGRDLLMLPNARDYKRVDNGDTGPNTGGMGAFAPCDVDEKIYREMIDDIRKIMYGFKAEDLEYKGAIFPGFILTQDGPKLLEINARFGDPETQVQLPLLNTDLLDIFNAIAQNRLGEIQPEYSNKYAVGVVLASENYPEKPKLNRKINLPNDLDPEVLIFHAGTNRNEGGELISAGGRVLTVVGLDQNLTLARTKAYKGASQINLEGMQYRTDIAAV